nr:glycoside hydrolase family 16 protein [uncultured Carboxylicivirga sp.]
MNKNKITYGFRHSINSITFIACILLPFLSRTDVYSQSPQVPQTIDNRHLVWHDEFNENGSPNPLNWNYEYGFVRNRELQWYQTNNAYCKDGKLIIEGKIEQVENPNYTPSSNDWRISRQYADYTSSCVITRELQEFKAGGYFEVKAKIDTTKGAWPAIWLLGTNNEWPKNGEIDMMEFYRINDRPHILANAAWGSKTRYVATWDGAQVPFSTFTQKDPNWSSKYHIWAMKWTQKEIELLLDGEVFNHIDLTSTLNTDGTNPFVGNKSFYILLNLAIGSNGGQPDNMHFPISFKVDYVRVYQ